MAEPVLALTYIYEDDFLFIVEKPCNTHSVGVKNTKSEVPSIGEILAEKYNNIGENPLEGGLINRLDYETSGLMIGAKDSKTHKALREMIQRGAIYKKYLALVEAELDTDETVQGWIGSRHRGSKKVTLWTKKPKQERALPATTYIKPMRKIYSTSNTIATLVEVEAHTARRHQVRVSCAAINVPLVGDSLYGSKTELSDWQISLDDKNQRKFLLHASYVKFLHPTIRDCEVECTSELKI